MLEDLQYDHPSKVFHGVRFVLLGFDPITKPKVLSKLLDGGGVDIGQYGPICTHVIVDKLIYDDPICVAARYDGKTLVNGLWVAHSFDVGMLVDPTSIMYRPLRDLKGIPGAKSLVVCLTGYQRQDRDDIMTMVDLMGANFSKPLVANKVTHLICYKFEGEKYELAKKMKKIKLVNHLWLEDCLKAWEIFPEADYNRSGYELEELEAEAKDSEEETDIALKQFQLPNPKQELQINQLDSNASRDLSNVVCTNDMVFATGKDIKPDQDPNLPEIHIQHPEVLDSRDARAFRNVSCVELVKSCDRATVSAAIGNGLSSTSGSERSPHSDASKLSPKSYSRKTPRETTPPMNSGKMTENLNTAPTVNVGKLNASRFDSSSMTEQLKDGTDIGLKIPKETVSHHEEQSSALDEKQKMDVYCGSSKSQKAGQKSKAHISAGLLEMNRSDLLEPISLISDPTETNNCLSNNVAHYSSLTAALNSPQRSPAKTSKYHSSSVDRKSPTCCTPVLKTVTSEISQDGNLEKALQTSSAGSKKASLTSKPENKDVINRQEHATGGSPKISSPRNKRLEIEKFNGSSNLSFHTDAHSTPPTRKMFSGKSWSKGKTNLNTNPKGSLYLNTSASEDDPAISSNLGEETSGHMKLEMVSPEINLNTEMEAETYDFSQSRNKVQQKSMSMDDETEVPEEEENEVRETFREEKYGEVEADIIEEDDKSEDAQTNKTTSGVRSYSTPTGEGTGTKQNKTTCGKRRLGESTRLKKAVKNISRGKKQPLSKIKKTTILSEAPEDKEEDEVQEAVNEVTYGEVEPDRENIGAEDKSEAYKTDCNALGVDSHKTSSEDEDNPKQNKATCGKRKLGESTHKDNEVREDINAGKKCSKIKKRLDPVSKLTNLKEAVNEEDESEKNEGSVPHLAGKTKRNKSTNKLDKYMEVEKENRPIHTEDQNVSHGKKQVRKLASNKSSSKIDLEASKSNPDRVQVHRPPKPEPAWFILSAHKLQRKEFQQVIRRLKGKVCRDSHQWSYQATHFIVADPVRRTEKFFAAAASGRWILKTDYLIDSSQAGKFLAEEPYEWHKSGLSEDGAINLEAPRKWRFHKERTGHGAFYGMSIIIYGECIAPSLDTLKRVLKAGEGKILATSPPYSRFLESGVDFAVVSPGMPRVDMWVQEFLGHEIPCVVADYLVEFVCKPGHSLERHVQYNTHALAEKALKNLVSRSEAIAELMTPPSHGGDSALPCHEVTTPPNDSDIPCQVCGSRDRGEEMLICGDESGSSGCGVGTHIDCCEPPLADVPEEDWFCPKCNESKSSKKP